MQSSSSSRESRKLTRREIRQKIQPGVFPESVWRKSDRTLMNTKLDDEDQREMNSISLDYLAEMHQQQINGEMYLRQEHPQPGFWPMLDSLTDHVMKLPSMKARVFDPRDYRCLSAIERIYQCDLWTLVELVDSILLEKKAPDQITQVSIRRARINRAWKQANGYMVFEGYWRPEAKNLRINQLPPMSLMCNNLEHGVERYNEN